MKALLNLLLLVSLLNASDGLMPVHYLSPPKLATENLGARVLCSRPMRKDSPKMAIEMSGDKTVIHNYGHGGSGWTLAPGCVRYLLEQFDDQVTAQKDESLAIVGAGVIGLLTAYMLIKRGYANFTIYAEQFNDLASHKAGGFCAPTKFPGATIDPELQSCMSIDAYRFYAEIARGENVDFDAQGARCMPVYMLRDETRMDAYVAAGVMKAPQNVIIDFSNGKRYDTMKVYNDAIFMDTERMMNSLNVFLAKKISMVEKHIDSFDEVDERCVFNCAGLGAQALNNDSTMASGQGHLILLEDQDPEKLNYMIGFQAGEGSAESGHVAKRSVYMFPKHALGTPETSVGVLGGTFIEGATDATPNRNEFGLLIERVREFFGE